jgi:hypothetical protein
MSLVKSKQRVADHGEVFTPAWMVEAMLDLVKDETERIDSRFLEPACGRHGDALTMRDKGGEPITFSEWGYLGKGKYQRRDFRFDVLTGSSAFSAEGSLFADLGKHEIFAPVKTHPPMTVRELAALQEPAI